MIILQFIEFYVPNLGLILPYSSHLNLPTENWPCALHFTNEVVTEIKIG